MKQETENRKHRAFEKDTSNLSFSKRGVPDERVLEGNLEKKYWVS